MQLELTINISKKKKTNAFLDNVILKFVIIVFAVIFLIIVAILSVFTIIPYEFIKYRILGYNRKPEVPPIPTLIKTDEYHLILDYIEEPNDEHQIASTFLYKIVDYGDETAIFKVKNDGKKTELDGLYLTPFKYELDNSLLLQSVRANVNGEPTSDLIKFNPTNGIVEIIKEIGQFELEKYDKEKKEISGHNLTEDIFIKLE